MGLSTAQWWACFAACLFNVFVGSRLGTGWFLAGMIPILGLQVYFRYANGLADAKAAQREHAARIQAEPAEEVRQGGDQ